MVEVIRLSALSAASSLKPSPQDNPTDANGRLFAAQIVHEFHARFGKLPPRTQDTWFVDFMACFHSPPFNLRCGARILKAAVVDEELAHTALTSKS